MIKSSEVLLLGATGLVLENKILSERTGQPLAKIEEDTERDNFMTANEALKYGLIDKVIEHI